MRLIMSCGALLTTLLFLSACTSGLDPDLMEGVLIAEPTPVVFRSASDVPRISVDEAKQHFDDGTAIFVDSRSAAEYTQSHIAGAISFTTLPPWSRETATAESELDDNLLVIAYCT